MVGRKRTPINTTMSHCVQVGGIEEYSICEAIQSGRLFKPVIAWCIGTCAKMFTSEVQFGHAGACANAERETADAKNKVGGQGCTEASVRVIIHSTERIKYLSILECSCAPEHSATSGFSSYIKLAYCSSAQELQ